jgi:hypothetical protein
MAVAAAVQQCVLADGTPQPKNGGELMATCELCRDDEVPDADILEHLRLLHPNVWGDGPMRWPNGDLVVVDNTLEPDDFAAPAADISDYQMETIRDPGGAVLPFAIFVAALIILTLLVMK